jgi:hypothetical protein
MDIAKKVFAAHTNRVTGKLSPEDVAAHVTELVEELA